MKTAIQQRALELGFDDCRFTTARSPEHADSFQDWLQAGRHGEMAWLARNAEKLAAVAADLKLRGASYVGTAVADLDDTDKHAELLTHAVNSLTGMDVAYLAHGILGDQARGEQEFQHAAQVIYTNFLAPVSLLTWLANFCVQRHAGTIAVLSSVAG